VQLSLVRGREVYVRGWGGWGEAVLLRISSSWFVVGVALGPRLEIQNVANGTRDVLVFNNGRFRDNIVVFVFVGTKDVLSVIEEGVQFDIDCTFEGKGVLMDLPFSINFSLRFERNS
jgi:hypothetical protein